MPKYGGQNRIDFGVHFNTDKSSLTEVQKAFQKLQDIKPADFKGSVDELREIKLQALKVQAALTKAFNVKLGSLNVQKFNKELKGLNIDKIYTDLTKLGSQGQVAFSKMATSMMTTNLQLKETHSLINSMGTTMMNTVKWGIASSVMNNFTQSVSQAFQYVKSLDSALTDIRIVTGDSTEQMAKFADQANRAAQQLGRSTMDYSKAALTFYQQGLSDEDVAARTEATLKAQNITGAGEQMADYLTAVWNGYKVANEEAELYVDKLAAVADSSASNMSQLAVAMSKVASTANMLGVPVDSLNAQIATIEATTRQAPETVGNALKTIYARINDIKTGSDDAEVSLGNYTEQMAKLGVNVLDASGNLRDTGDVIEEIGGKWESLSREQQIYLARTMAGQRQYNNLLALFENWGKYTDLVNVSMEAQGTTMQKNSRYMDSLAAHMEQLGAAGERVKSAMIDSDSFKGLIDIGTGLTNLFANLIESIGGGGTAFLALGGIVTQVFSGVIAREITNFITNLNAAKENQKLLQAEILATKKLQTSKAYTNGNIKASVDAKRAAQDFYDTMSAGQIEAYNGIVKEISEVEQEIIVLKKAKNAADELLNNIAKNAGVDNIDSTLDNLISHFERLKQSLGSNLLNADDFFATKQQLTNLDKILDDLEIKVPGLKELISFFEQIKDPAQMDADTVKNLHDRLDQVYAKGQEKIDLMVNSQQANADLTQTEAKLDSLKNKAKDFLRSVDMQNSIKGIVSFAGGLGQVTSAFMSLSNITKIWENDSLTTGQKVLQLFSNLTMSTGMLINGFKQIGKGFGDLSKGVIGIATKVIAARRGMTAETLKATVAEHGKSVANQVEGMTALEGAAANGSLAASFGTLILAALPWIALIGGISLAIYGLVKAYNADADAAKRAGEVSHQAAEHYNEVKASADELYNSINRYKELQDSFSTLVEGSEEWNSALQESNQLVLDLINKFPQLIDNVENVHGKLIIDPQALEQAQEKMNHVVQTAKVSSNYLNSQANIASTKSQATDLGREHSYTDYSSGEAVTTTLSSDQVEKIASIFGDFEKGLIEGIKPDELSKYISEQTNIQQENIDALLQDQDALRQLNETVQQNTMVTELANTQAAANSTELTESDAYKGATDLDKQIMERLGGQDLAQAQERIAQTWEDKIADGINRFSSTSNDTYEEVLNKLKEIGFDYKKSTQENPITGTNANRVLHFDDAEGNDKAMSAEEVASTIAASEALKELGNSAKDTQEMLSNLGEVGDENAEAVRQLLAGNGFSSMTEKEVKKLAPDEKGNYSQQLQDYFSENFKQAGFKTADAFKEAFIQQQKNTQDAFKKVLADTSEYVQSAFKKGLDTEDLSLDAQKSIVENLQKAFNEGGPEAVNQLTSFYDKITDFKGFDKITQGIDFTSITASELKDKLEQAGIATNLTTEQLNAYIEAQKGAAAVSNEEKYKNIHEISDSIKRGDTIDEQQANKLRDAGINLDQFFEKGLDGTYKLKTSAEEFQQYANNISLQGFKEQLAQLEDRISGQKDFEKSKYSASNNEGNQQSAFKSFSSNAEDDSNKLAAQVAFLQTLPEISEDVKKAINEVKAGEEDISDQAKIIAKTVEDNKDSWENNKEKIAENTQEAKKLEEQLADAMKAPLDPDIDQDKWEGLADYIEEIAKAGDKDNKGALQISETLAEDREAAEELSQAMLRYDHALQEVNDHYDDWAAALSSGNMQEQAEVGNQLKNVYSDMLDLPFENLSSDFTTSTQNLQLLKQAANGSEDAYRQLQEAAQQDIIAHLDLSDSDLQNFQSKLNTVQSLLDKQHFPDLEVGANLDTGNFLASLTDMVNAANMTAQQATDYLASMGIDAQIVENKAKSEDKKEITGVEPHFVDVTDDFIWYTPTEDGVEEIKQKVHIPKLTYTPTDPVQIQDTKETSGHTLKVKSARKSSGGNFKFKQSAYGGGNKGSRGSSGGGSKGGGGKGSSSKPSQAKKNITKIETKKKTAEKDPYYKNTLSLEKQSNILKKIQDQQKGLVNKDRLKNLQDQNKTLQEQNKLLRQRQDISNNKAEENSTANLRTRLQKEFKNIKFDADGNIADLNKVEKAAVNSYNKAAQAANNTFKKAQDDYNKWITGTWNKHSKEWQDNHQHEKEAWDNRIKKAEENAKKAIEEAEKEYKTKEDLIKNYQKALQEDQKKYEEYMDNIRKIMQHTFEASKIKVDLALDTGQLERDWQQFENKVIRKIDDDDIFGNAAANFRELTSYFNSEELSKTSNEIKTLYKDLNNIEKGSFSNILTADLNNDASWKDLLKKGDQEAIRKYGEEWLQDRLNELVKQQQDSLMEMQDLIDDIKDQYLDMIDQAKDKMDQHIDQYDRINSIIEHNVKLTELLYGDKGYETLNKYYELQKSNNMATLESLKQQQDFWQQQMNNEVVGSDSWKKFKENYEDAMDAVYSKMEDMIDLLTEQFEKKLAAAVDRVNNKLTGGLGTDYLDEQWDYLNNYDDYFLDTYNATTGVEDVTRAYQQAIDDAAANPKQQQRLNSLMNDQLKILREKDKLTEYDLDRAKSMLEVEKARMALEDARNNKTKMRLRRDSQGNYTYQYVADEEKLNDLQQALADAQNDLYNTDKEHYKENLNTLYDTYKEYIEKMKELTEEYNATQDEAERQRIQNRINLLNASYEDMYAGLTEDNKYNIQYLTQSFADGMHIDMSGLSSEEQWEVLKQNVPWAKSNIQDLADSIVGEGGLLPATKSAIEEFGAAVKATDEAIDQILNTGGTSVDQITQATDQNGNAIDQNILNEQEFLMANQDLINACKNDLDQMKNLLDGVNQYWKENTASINSYISALQNGYDTLQALNNSSLTSDKSLTIAQNQIDTTVPGTNNWGFTGNISTDAKTLRENLNNLLDEYNKWLQGMLKDTNQFDTGGYTGDILDGDMGLAFLHSKELVLNPVDTENILAAVAMVRDITARMNVQTELNNLSASTGQLLNNLAENSTLLDQQVHIDANFPNVSQHTQIEEAFNNLVNMAAMRASEYRD